MEDKPEYLRLRIKALEREWNHYREANEANLARVLELEEQNAALDRSLREATADALGNGQEVARLERERDSLQEKLEKSLKGHRAILSVLLLGGRTPADMRKYLTDLLHELDPALSGTAETATSHSGAFEGHENGD